MVSKTGISSLSDMHTSIRQSQGETNTPREAPDPRDTATLSTMVGDGPKKLQIPGADGDEKVISSEMPPAGKTPGKEEPPAAGKKTGFWRSLFQSAEQASRDDDSPTEIKISSSNAPAPPPAVAVEAHIARSSLESTQDITRVSKKNEALYDGLKAICDNPGSSSDSKTLARLALEMNTREVGKEHLLRARELVLKELASPSGQSLPDILGRLTLDWSEDVRGTRELEYLVWYGAKTVEELLGDDPEKKYVLDFFLRLFSGYVGERHVALTRKSALRHLEEAHSMTAARLMSMIILDAVEDYRDEFQMETSAGNMINYALEAIVESPFATKAEKSLAQKGIRAGSREESRSKRYTKFRKAMEEIVALSNPYEQELRETKKILGSPEAENAIVVDNEVVTINGVKLKRKK